MIQQQQQVHHQTLWGLQNTLNSQWAVRTNGRPHHSSQCTGRICVTAAVGCRQRIFISLSAASQGSVLSPCPVSLFSAFHSTLSCLLQSPVGVIQFSLSLSLEGTSVSLANLFLRRSFNHPPWGRNATTRPLPLRLLLSHIFGQGSIFDMFPFNSNQMARFSGCEKARHCRAPVKTCI